METDIPVSSGKQQELLNINMIDPDRAIDSKKDNKKFSEITDIV
ncbi:hypothetical protein [Akkermansia sp.]|jgi:hypothetical protein|nr:hypothetical protein [uncultured Akkermansia sp.]MEE0764681.1 hypothetical protein [Akkermansia sp.]